MFVARVLVWLLAICSVGIIIGWWRFRALVTDDTRELLVCDTPSVGPEQLRLRWDSLPDPVQRYLRYAITENAPAIRTAHLTHDGLFRTAPNQRWFGIRGEELFTTGQPGFVWNAMIRPIPMLWIEARDRLFCGRGHMLVKILSTFTVADARGPEIDQGSLLRWLAESMWFPYGFVGDQVEWESIDRNSARATLREGNVSVSAVVDIDDAGRLVAISADRFRDIGGGKAVLTRWIGRASDYLEFNGFRVPSTVEVSWELETGSFSYARFHVTSLEYNVTGPSEVALKIPVLAG
jgi:hypothetical protein